MHSKNIFRAARAQLSFYLGGDASENGDFQMGKQRLQGYKNFPTKINDVFKKHFPRCARPAFILSGGRCVRKWRFSNGKTALQGYKNFPSFHFLNQIL